VGRMTLMRKEQGWEETFSEAQRGADRQAQLELKDNIGSIYRAKGLPSKTLEAIFLNFRYMLVSCVCSVLIMLAA